jgi:hypothetical protein
VKVFISWSGDTSKQVALILRDWLSNVLQSVEPWMSDMDIEKGTRSMTEIAESLAGTVFGLVVVTKTNQEKPWLNFEAGALSKAVENEAGRLWVLLFNMLNQDLLQGRPIGQFQNTLMHREDIRSLLGSINKASKPSLSELKLNEAFEMWWPKLDEKLQAITVTDEEPEPTTGSQVSKTHPRWGSGGSISTSDAAIDEILGTVRRLERDLSNTQHGQVFGRGIAEGEDADASIVLQFEKRPQTTVLATIIEMIDEGFRFVLPANRPYSLSGTSDTGVSIDLPLLTRSEADLIAGIIKSAINRTDISGSKYQIAAHLAPTMTVIYGD